MPGFVFPSENKKDIIRAPVFGVTTEPPATYVKVTSLMKIKVATHFWGFMLVVGSKLYPTQYIIYSSTTLQQSKTIICTSLFEVSRRSQ